MSSRAWWIAALLVAVVVAGVALYLTSPHHATLGPSSTPDSLQNSEIQTILAPDAIPAVYDPHFVAAGKAGMPDSLHVIGVEVGGEAHAYPIPYLSRVEIVDDRLGGTNIAVTW